ncbi:hypothetical protein TNCV_2683511 [Trichonephila clavipes]|nr:hypothetical protein TNCV_2683511 [Trichonephila clavipes]
MFHVRRRNSYQRVSECYCGRIQAHSHWSYLMESYCYSHWSEPNGCYADMQSMDHGRANMSSNQPYKILLPYQGTSVRKGACVLKDCTACTVTTTVASLNTAAYRHAVSVVHQIQGIQLHIGVASCPLFSRAVTEFNRVIC